MAATLRARDATLLDLSILKYDMNAYKSLREIFFIKVISKSVTVIELNSESAGTSL